MSEKTSNNFAIEWSEDITDWIISRAEDDDIDPEIATYSALAAAVVLARSIGMQDVDIRQQFETILLEEFPEDLMLSTKA